ncbi:MAG TPA: nucleotidyltransferase family protein [Thermodesulfovibrionia bacterium]|nr:nucleotidyltransferase family protein [Thermodesulfovibrionia bacterium]
MKKTVKSIEQVKEILIKYKDEVKSKYCVSEIGIFGSFVKGQQKKRSDVDIVVEFDEENIPGLLKFIELERYFERLLGKKVDLVRKEGIRPELRDSILKEVVYI